MNPLLDGARAKLERARVHAAQIDSALESWRCMVREGNHSSIKMRPDGNGFEMVISELPPLDKTLPLMVGDFVHNIRSSLDHLAAQLSVQAGHHIGETRHLNFPVFKSEILYTRNYRHKLIKLVSSEALAAIEASQPYQDKKRGLDPALDPLWVLAELDNIDKHRMLVVVSKQFRKRGARVFLGRGAEPIDIPIQDDIWRPMENGTTVANINLSFSGPHRPEEVGVQLDMTSQVQFANTGLVCDGMTLDYVLPKLFNRVTRLLQKFEATFFPS